MRLCALLGVLLLAGSYLGALHPLGDSLAVFRMWIAGGVAFAGLCLVLLRLRRDGVAAFVLAAIAAGPIGWISFASSAAPLGQHVTIYTKNILGGWGDNDAIVADILASGADIVLLQELARTRGDYPGALQESHPYQQVCRFSDWSGMAVLSRWPLSDPYCSPHRSFAAARVATPEGPVWAISTHLVWPYPHIQAEAVQQAMPFLESVGGRAIVAGDFNMVPWGNSVRSIARATGTARIGPLFATIDVRGLPMTIDHVLTDGAGTTERRPLFGSDHHGLVARIGWETP